MNRWNAPAESAGLTGWFTTLISCRRIASAARDNIIRLWGLDDGPDWLVYNLDLFELRRADLSTPDLSLGIADALPAGGPPGRGQPGR